MTSHGRVQAWLAGSGMDHADRDSEVIALLTAALEQRGYPVEILNLHQVSTSAGNDSEAITLVEYRHGPRSAWVAGKDRSVLTASLTAIMNTTADIPGAIAR